MVLLAAGELNELQQREAEQGITPDPALEAFMKAATQQGRKQSIATDFIIKMLALDVSLCAGLAAWNGIVHQGQERPLLRVTACFAQRLRTIFCCLIVITALEIFFMTLCMIHFASLLCFPLCFLPHQTLPLHALLSRTAD